MIDPIIAATVSTKINKEIDAEELKLMFDTCMLELKTFYEKEFESKKEQILNIIKNNPGYLEPCFRIDLTATIFYNFPLNHDIEPKA